MNRPIQKAELKGRSTAPTPESSAPHGQEYGEECGGSGGVPYRFFAQAPDRISKITVWYRQLVDGFQVESEKGPLPKVGGTGRHKDIRQETFELGPNEFITGVSVEYWTYLDRITFHTNKRDYGPFGGAGGLVKRNLQAPPGRPVVGFKGRHWDFVDSIQLII